MMFLEVKCYLNSLLESDWTSSSSRAGGSQSGYSRWCTSRTGPQWVQPLTLSTLATMRCHLFLHKGQNKCFWLHFWQPLKLFVYTNIIMELLCLRLFTFFFLQKSEPLGSMLFPYSASDWPWNQNIAKTPSCVDHQLFVWQIWRKFSCSVLQQHLHTS